MQMDAQITKIIVDAVFGIIGILITGYLIPWIKAKIGENKYNTIVEYTELAVRSAEQLYTPEEWKEKKQYVLNYITNKAKEIGLDLTAIDIENIIEGIVNSVKKG